jgi:hypothetical protein
MTNQFSFKAGDRVRVAIVRRPHESRHWEVGSTGTITEVVSPFGLYFAYVSWDHDVPQGPEWPSPIACRDLVLECEHDSPPHATYAEWPDAVTWDTNVRCTTPAPHKCPRAPWWAFWNPCSRFGWLTYAAAGACVPAVVEAIVRHLHF